MRDEEHDLSVASAYSTFGEEDEEGRLVREGPVGGPSGSITRQPRRGRCFRPTNGSAGNKLDGDGSRRQDATGERRPQTRRAAVRQQALVVNGTHGRSAASGARQVRSRTPPRRQGHGEREAWRGDASSSAPRERRGAGDERLNPTSRAKLERDDLREPKSEDAATLTRPQPMTQWHRGHRHVGTDSHRAAVELDDHWSRRNEVHADTLPVCLGLQHLPVDPDEAVTFEQSGPRRTRAKGKIRDDDPAMVEPRHEAERRDSENVGGNEEREVRNVGKGCDANAPTCGDGRPDSCER